MNLRGGLFLIRHTWMSWLQQPIFFFLLAFGWMIPTLIYLFVWYTASSGKTLGGMTQHEFVAYYLVFALVNQLTYSQTNWTVGDSIRNGSLNTLLIRPISPIFHVIAAEIAGKVVYMAFVIPVACILDVLLQPEIHLTLLNSLLFLPTLILAWLLRFFWGYWLALLAFWITRAEALLGVQDALTFLLAGQVAPLVLLPGALQYSAKLLPFRYMISFPIEVLTGHLSMSDLWSGLACQLGWLCIAFVLFRLIWHAGQLHYTAVGG